MSLGADLPEGDRHAVPIPTVRPLRIGLCGTPSAMTHWAIHVLRVILGAMVGDHDVVHGNYAAEFTASAAGGHAAVICTSDCPEIALCRLLAAGPVVVIAEDPSDVIDDLVAVSGVGAVDALRLAARSLCALQPLLADGEVATFGTAHLADGIDGFVDALLAALDIAPTAEQRGDIGRRLAVAGVGGTVRDHLAHHFPVVAARLSELGSDAAIAGLPGGEGGQLPLEGVDLLAGSVPAIGTAAVKLVARAYAALARGGTIVGVEWPAAIFSSGDAVGEFVAGPCEMIGPARIMIYGPYMHLPPGRWTARIELEVADNRSGNRLKVDLVGGPRLLVSASADMPTLGQYAFSLEFAVAEPLDPLELRFQIESGAIEGRFLLRGVTMIGLPGD